MRVTFTDDAWADYCSWSDDRKMLARINRLIGEALREPGAGIGKPEPLGQNLSGYWSRRITDEHRLVYTVDGDSFIIIQARYHY
jgi:toxin YoeB